MRFPAALLLAPLLAACATTSVPPPAAGLFDDRLFAAPSERISAADVFALSDDMRRYLADDVERQTRSRGSRQGLLDALYTKGQLKLEYDSVQTRNAAQAFAERAGNCLSLVIMTAAFAKAMDLPVRFQSVTADETVSRTGDMQFFVGHVNLSLGGRPAEHGMDRTRSDDMTVDFYPQTQAGGQRTQPIREATVVAMYMNNRGAEALAQGKVDDAYWWARAAIDADPAFASGYNTLGVIYQRRGHGAQAEAALTVALAREPRNTHAMSNLVRVLAARGRTAESAALARRLEEIEPNPVFALFDRGRIAYDNGDYQAAKELFAQEVERAPYYHEFRYWLAAAQAQLGNRTEARRQMALALEYSTARVDHDLYAAKLARLKSSAPH